MGIEPARRRADDASTALKAAGDSPQTPQGQALTDSAQSDWWTLWWKALQNDAYLATIVAAWPELPEVVKTFIRWWRYACPRLLSSRPSACYFRASFQPATYEVQRLAQTGVPAVSTSKAVVTTPVWRWPGSRGRAHRLRRHGTRRRRPRPEGRGGCGTPRAGHPRISPSPASRDARRKQGTLSSRILNSRPPRRRRDRHSESHTRPVCTYPR